MTLQATYFPKRSSLMPLLKHMFLKGIQIARLPWTVLTEPQRHDAVIDVDTDVQPTSTLLRRAGHPLEYDPCSHWQDSGSFPNTPVCNFVRREKERCIFGVI